jgi:ubiquinone/menaquinone biosynthesis C-methylase UbiE
VDSISFDSIAPVYDETRALDPASFNAALDFLTARFPPLKYKDLFEPGIGTGRIGVPMAERGYRVTGVDISENMLNVLAQKLSQRKPALPLEFHKADITFLPFGDAVFDIAVATHIFHLVRHWRKAMSEVFRVLKTDAPLVLLFTGGGTEAPDIKARYRALSAEYGYTVRHIGMNSTTDLPEYAASIGRHIEWVRGRWQWKQRVSLEKALADIGNKSYSSSKHVPNDVHVKVMTKLELELKRQYGNLALELEIPLQVDMALILPAA